jgi:hypothetical protein
LWWELTTLDAKKINGLQENINYRNRSAKLQGNTDYSCKVVTTFLLDILDLYLFALAPANKFSLQVTEMLYECFRVQTV